MPAGVNQAAIEGAAGHGDSQVIHDHNQAVIDRQIPDLIESID